MASPASCSGISVIILFDAVGEESILASESARALPLIGHCTQARRRCHFAVDESETCVDLCLALLGSIDASSAFVNYSAGSVLTY